MSMKTTNLTNKAGETTGTVSFDEGTHSWRITSKAESNFQRTFPSAQAAFYFLVLQVRPTDGQAEAFSSGVKR
jgi:hypothetical protein